MLFIKKKNIVYLTLFFILLCFLMHDLQELIEFLTYDVNAPDLIGDGVALRNKFFASSYAPAALFNMIMAPLSILLPIMTLISMYYYRKSKDKVLKYTIGKSVNVKKYLLKLKFKVAVLPLIFYNTIILVYFIASWLITGLKVRIGANFEQTFRENTILHFADNSLFWYMFFLIVTSAIYIVTTTVLLTTILDYKYNYIVVFIVYFLVVYLGNDFIQMYIHKRLYFTVSMNTGYGLANNYELVVSYIYMLVIYLFFRLTHRKEF